MPRYKMVSRQPIVPQTQIALLVDYSLSDDFIDEQAHPNADDEEDDNNKQQQSSTVGEEQQHQQPTADKVDVPGHQQQMNAETNVEVFKEQTQPNDAEGGATSEEQQPTTAKGGAIGEQQQPAAEERGATGEQQQSTAAKEDATGEQQQPTAAERDVPNKQPAPILAQQRQEGSICYSPRSPPSNQCSNTSMFECILLFFLTKVPDLIEI